MKKNRKTGIELFDVFKCHNYDYRYSTIEKLQNITSDIFRMY